MVRRGSFIGGQDNLSVPDAPTIGAATAGSGQVSVAFTAPSDVGDDPITNFGVSVFPATGTTRTFRVTVASGNLYGGGTGNIYYIDGVANPALTLIKGFTYVFDQSDSSNSGHPLRFKDGSGSSYSTGVTVAGTQGSSGASVTLVLAEDATEPSQYYCTVHGNGMGNLITLVAPSASDDPLGQAQYSNTGSSSPITVTGLSNGTSYVAKAWAINDYGNGPLSDATSSFTPASIALIKGGYAASSPTNTVAKITVETTGNATDFGDLSASNYSMGALSSDTRSIAVGGYYNNAAYTNIIEYFTFASAGNATDFGDATTTLYNTGGLANNVRGVFAKGVDNAGNTVNVMEYITIASTGNSIDFGDTTSARSALGSVASTTRGVFAGGYDTSGIYSNVMDYITIASANNATDFGDLTVGRGYLHGGANSSTRGVFGSAYSGSYVNTIDYITIASTSNATDFGDSTANTYGSCGVSNSTRGIFAGGQDTSGRLNIIEKIEISTTANATDFGDLLTVASFIAGTCAGNPAVQS